MHEDRVEEAAKEAAKRLGCTCEPGCVVSLMPSGYDSIHLVHENDCALAVRYVRMLMAAFN